MHTCEPTLRVGVKYCGHCQPHRNMVELMGLVRALAPDIEFLRWSEPDYDVLLILQACDVACAEAPPVALPLVEVIVSSIDFEEYESDEELARATVAALRRAGDAT